MRPEIWDDFFEKSPKSTFSIGLRNIILYGRSNKKRLLQNVNFDKKKKVKTVKKYKM